LRFIDVVGFLGKLHLGNCFQKLSDGFFEKFMPRNLESFFDGGGMAFTVR
jgi:hypothetical protein